MKVVELVIFSTAFFNLFNITRSLDVQWETGKMNYNKVVAHSFANHLKPFFNSESHQLSFPHGECSPESYDTEVRKNTASDHWYTQHGSYIMNCCQNLRPINLDSLHYPLSDPNDQERFGYSDLQKIIEEYNAQIDIINQQERKISDYYAHSINIAFLNYLFIVISAALFTAKWVLGWPRSPKARA